MQPLSRTQPSMHLMQPIGALPRATVGHFLLLAQDIRLVSSMLYSAASLRFHCSELTLPSEINTEIIERHLETYSKLPDRGVPYNDNFLAHTAYYECPKLSCDSSYYFNLAIEWLYTKNLAQPRGTLPGHESHSSWRWNPILHVCPCSQVGEQEIVECCDGPLDRERHHP